MPVAVKASGDSSNVVVTVIVTGCRLPADTGPAATAARINPRATENVTNLRMRWPSTRWAQQVRASVDIGARKPANVRSFWATPNSHPRDPNALLQWSKYLVR